MLKRALAKGSKASLGAVGDLLATGQRNPFLPAPIVVKKERPALSEDEYERQQIDLQAAFSLFDTNNSGTLDWEEFRKILTLGSKTAQLNDAQFDAMFMRVDSDNSGVVNFAEYTAWALGPAPAALTATEPPLEPSQEEPPEPPAIVKPIMKDCGV